MIAGETDLLTKDNIVHYALTSGSVDNPQEDPGFGANR